VIYYLYKKFQSNHSQKNYNCFLQKEKVWQ
jgi:hypothetical protein